MTAVPLPACAPPQAGGAGEAHQVPRSQLEQQSVCPRPHPLGHTTQLSLRFARACHARVKHRVRTTRGRCAGSF